MVLFSWLANNWVEVVAGLVALKQAAEIFVRLTPSDRDDAAVARIGAFLDRLAHLGLKKK